MKIRIGRPALGILSLCTLFATLLPLASAKAQSNLPPGCTMGSLGRRPGCEASPNRIDPNEQAAYDTFSKEATVDTKIALGEQFDRKYPQSRYQESVDTQLAFLYFNAGNSTKFYAAADRVLAANPKDLPMLSLVGWVIARNYKASDADAAAKLDQAETYEKRALSLVAAMKKPRKVTQAEFDNSQTSLAWRAHSGLGTVYFRRRDFADSAVELQMAVKQEGSEPDPTDLYVLGIDLQNLNRFSEAADDFAQCSAATGDMQQPCQQAYEQASHAAVESAEKKAYDAFNNALNGDTQIQLGEKFDQTYPLSEYAESVDSTLATLYQGKQDWPKFYATADKVLAEDPDNVPVLTLLGWVIPRHYDSEDPNAASELDKAEKYEKHALDLISKMQKPSDLTAAQFEDAKTVVTAKAHSGLGAIYFRRGDYADSASELRLAAQGEPDPFDYYMFGIDLHKLGRDAESAQAFAKCGAVPGYMQMQCNRDAEKTSENAAQLASVTAKSVPSVSVSAAARDIPPQTGNGPAAAIRAETVIVPVRVVVRDNKGRALPNLSKDNFKLYQDGALQEISNFTAVVPETLASPRSADGSSATGPSSSQDAAGSANRRQTAVAAPHFIALFFDDVHLYFGDVAQTRSAAQKYISTLQPTDRVAIVTASGEGAVEFTSDRDTLHAALQKLRAHPLPGGPSPAAGAFNCPPPMTYTEADIITNGGAMSDTILGIAAGDIASCVKAPGDFTGQARADAENANLAGQEAMDSVFGKLKTLVRQMSVLPGDRAVVLVSPGFVNRNHDQAFVDVTNLAIRSNVVINTLDAKGVYGTSPRGRNGMPTDKWDPDRFSKFGYGHAMEDGVLQDLADSTGGLFIHFNNDFAGAMREMSEPPEAYYLLGYAPRNLQPDGKFHVLKVSLASGAHGTVQARRGFFAPSHLETPEEAAKREIEDATFSGETRHDLPVTIETVLTRDNSGAEKLGVKTHVDASQLHFTKAGSANREDLTVSAVLFDADGNYVTGMQKAAQMGLDDSTLAQVEQTGFYVELDLDVKPGNYVLRMVARDSNDGRISAENTKVTVPN